MNRRQFVAAALASPLAAVGPARARAPIYIADMHFHLFFFGKAPASTQPLARNMASGQATLVSWSLVGDVPWLKPNATGFTQNGSPKPGEAVAWFSDEMRRVQAHIVSQKLNIARGADDIDRALAGEPHVILSVEGATFADEDLGQLQVAYDQGVRHVQLVHFIGNAIGDHQTAAPVHNGLTDYGRRAILECNRLGILVDLAHCTSAVVQQALAVSKAPMIWSHSSVNPAGAANWRMPGWRARQLAADDAKAIAAAGGVVGLWALGGDVGKSPEAYADRIAEQADRLGENHIGFGTDMNALATPALTNFADLRRVVTILEQRGLPEARIRKIAIENYARVLRLAFQSREA